MAKSIVIVGYGPGISAAVADKFGTEGFSVALIGRNADRLIEGVQTLQAMGISATFCVADAGDALAIQTVRALLGPIAVVHWNAFGGHDCGDLVSSDLQAIARLFDLPVMGLLAATQEAFPDLKSSAEGALLVTNGALGDIAQRTDALAAAYGLMGVGLANAAKAKLVGLLAERLRADGIYVGEVTVDGAIKGTAWGTGEDAIEPSAVADLFWNLYRRRNAVRGRISPAGPTMTAPKTMQALRFHNHGEWADVLHLEEAPVPNPRPGQIRVRVHACALNPMDWVLCLGFMPGPQPGGIGLDVSGTVDAVGNDVTNVRVGDHVFGVPDYMHYPTAGVADYAILGVWEPVPTGLDLLEAAAFPMAVETAVRCLDLLGVSAGQTVLVNGGGTMVGFAAVQIALMRGAKVIATAGETFASRLASLGAKVTPYGEGMIERVRAIADGAPDLVLHTALAPGVLPDLIGIVDGDPQRVMSISDFDEEGLGVRTTGREPDLVPRYDALKLYAQLAAEGRFTIPVARTFSMEEWRPALELCRAGRAHGKLLILPDRPAKTT